LSCDELHPEWTPDGQSILFASDCQSIFEPNFDIYSVNADGSGLRRVTFGAMDELAPDWGIYEAGG
jgi:Tol biopolymer transport system component